MMTRRIEWPTRLRMTQESKWSEVNEVCAVGDTDLLEEMLKSGKYEHIDYKDPDWGERAPLHWCCIKGKSDMAQALLEKGAHPGIRSSCGWTPAHFAAEGGKTHVLRMLHQNNAPMDRKDPFGDTPRHIAQIYGHKEAVEFLVLAEAEYKTWRRKAELTGEADPYDDEDLEWCYRNKVEPEKFVTDDELAEINSTVTSLSIAESLASATKGKSKNQRTNKGGKSSGQSKAKKTQSNSRKNSNASVYNKKINKSSNEKQKAKRKTSIQPK